ncbi:hypothetical protein G5I_13122 [Acromyrmex echinatior]|uniref:Uncharacterized protein n=1 Tax=Acromyrmex echinatior TaxID=103372 RepID=F4X463_ACREC|nr:hypothetical protein G5I_13122 [Acromyrmex echinatior]
MEEHEDQEEETQNREEEEIQRETLPTGIPSSSVLRAVRKLSLRRHGRVLKKRILSRSHNVEVDESQEESLAEKEEEEILVENPTKKDVPEEKEEEEEERKATFRGLCPLSQDDYLGFSLNSADLTHDLAELSFHLARDFTHENIWRLISSVTQSVDSLNTAQNFNVCVFNVTVSRGRGHAANKLTREDVRKRSI